MTMVSKDVAKNFKIKSSLKEIQPVVGQILALLQETGAPAALLHDIKLSAEEAIINAVKHGSKLKEDLPVAIAFSRQGDVVRVAVEDCGSGYDHQCIPDPTLDENISKGRGRGIFLIRKLMDEVHFNPAGNRIEMVKYIKQ